MMYTYLCLDCGKQHKNPTEFLEPFQTTCLRCSHSFQVTREMIRLGSDSESAPRREETNSTRTPGQKGSVSTLIAPAQKSTTRQLRAEADEEFPEDEEGSVGSSSKLVSTTKKPTKRRRRAKGSEGDEDSMEAILDDVSDEESEDLEDSAPKADKPKKTIQDPAKKPAGKKGWLKVAGGALPILLICGVGGYMVFGRSGTPTKSAAKSSTSKEKSKAPVTKATPAPKKPDEKKVDPPPVVAVKPAVMAFTLSAPRLAAEFASGPAGTDFKYKDAWMEVSGLFDRLETTSPAKGTAVVQALFRTELGTISCNLSSVTVSEMIRWKALKHGKHFNVQGVYGMGCVLSKCTTAESKAIADATFGGKPVELVGVVDSVLLPMDASDFPIVKVESGTNSVVSIHCVFKKVDAPQLKLLNPGAAVVIKGVCAGRHLVSNTQIVRLDNCEFVSATGPAPSVSRLSAIDFVRPFEEDLRSNYFPPRDPRVRVESPLPVTQLSKEWKADSKSLEKYRNRLITVVGRVGRKVPGQLILESPETDQTLEVACRFSKEIRDRLSVLPEFRVQGVCNGMEGPKTLRLDDCGVDASFLLVEGSFLTAAFLPHKAEKTFFYDIVEFPVVGKGARIYRQVWYQRDNGATETVLTHTARFLGQSLFTPVKGDWTISPRTSKGRLAGPSYFRQVSPITVEFGQRVPNPKGGFVVAKEPVLKVGAKAGESWEWSGETTRHAYTVERFDRWRGRPSVVIKEVIYRLFQQGQDTEVEHTYVRDLGEVERREWLRISSTEKKLILEKKMILEDDQMIGPPKPKG